MWVHTYSSSHLLTSAALIMAPSHSRCPVESEEVRGGINGPGSGALDSSRKTIVGASKSVSSHVGFKASWRRIPTDRGHD